MKPAERDQFVQKQLAKFFKRVRNGEGPKPGSYKSERKVLERLIPIPTDGFRGITLTAIMGKLVNEDVHTGNQFDSINPRGVFERGIRPVLKENKVPTGASPPLNVAKNVQVLDEKWAEGRKPEDAALAAVDYIRRINRHWANEELRDDLIMMFMQRLLAYADEVGSHVVSLPGLDEEAPNDTAVKILEFAIKHQEGGATPQFVVGSLLSALRSTDRDYKAVEGLEASVFGTNTTSNKPADLWERLADDSLGNLYEVTCKKVDVDRLDAAVDSFAKLGLPNAPITFVCRMLTDVSTLKLTGRSIVHRGVTFQFIDLGALVVAIYLLLTEEKRRVVLEEIAGYVADPSRKIATKSGWNEIVVG